MRQNRTPSLHRPPIPRKKAARKVRVRYHHQRESCSSSTDMGDTGQETQFEHL